MKNAAHTIREELQGIVMFIGCIWGAFILNWALFFVDFNDFGLVPRTLRGTVGIVSMPFLHANWSHLLGNTVPLGILLALLAGSKARSWEIVAAITAGGGSLLWAFGRQATHIGASELIFGLVAFLVISGLLERRVIPLIVSFIVGSLYGSTLLWGVLPSPNAQVSWDGHACGAIAGGLTAWWLAREWRAASSEQRE